MQEVIGVSFRQATKVYYFSPIEEELKSGDEVVVDTAGGLAVGVVAKPKFLVKDTEIEQPLRPVVRKVTNEDKEKIEKQKRKAEENLPIIVQKIEALKLPMKVIEVVYAFDGSKVTISYTSDDRVDFRELLKVLASTLKTKIELRQIGIRDEVKSVGALGLCGRPCCCTTFLQQSEHVVVKMAKTQNMSLSPSKTGGACGKMMCCLAFEEPVYKELLSKMPKNGTVFETPEGKGTVCSSDIIKGVITLKVVSDDDSYKFVDYTCKDLGIDLYGDEGNCNNEKRAVQGGCLQCSGADCVGCAKQNNTNHETNLHTEAKNFTEEERVEILTKFNEIKRGNNNESLQSPAKKVDFKGQNAYNKIDEGVAESVNGDIKNHKKNQKNRHGNFHRNFKPKKGENL